jgi:hypothetical protein
MTNLKNFIGRGKYYCLSTVAFLNKIIKDKSACVC